MTKRVLEEVVETTINTRMYSNPLPPPVLPEEVWEKIFCLASAQCPQIFLISHWFYNVAQKYEFGHWTFNYSIYKDTPKQDIITPITPLSTKQPHFISSIHNGEPFHSARSLDIFMYPIEMVLTANKIDIAGTTGGITKSVHRREEFFGQDQMNFY